jgi:hypothetical protein
MFGGPTTTIGEAREGLSAVVVAPATDELVEGFGALDDLKATVMEGLVEFIRSGGHDADGWRSPVGWLRAHVSMTKPEAIRWAAQARSLAAWPTLAGLFFTRELSAAQVEVVCRSVPKALVELYAQHDAEISPLLVGLCVDDTTTAIGDWVAKAESVTSPDPAEVVDPDGPLPSIAHVRLSSFGPDDRTAVAGELDATTAAIVAHALTVATRPDLDDEDRMVSQRNAEALGVIARFYLDHHDGGARARQHPHLNLTLDVPGLYKAILSGLGIRTATDLDAFLAIRPVSILEEAIIRHALAHATGRPTSPDGHTLPPEVVTTVFGPGSTISRVLMADGEVLDHSRKVRCATGALRDTVLIRDHGCRFPTPTGERCDAPATWIDGHHITHWRHGGTTSLDNTLALCANHHGAVHRNRWSCTVDPTTGAVTVTGPDGSTTTGPPRDARPPELPLHHPVLDDLIPQLPAAPPTRHDSAWLRTRRATPRVLPGDTVTAPVRDDEPLFAALGGLADALLSDDPGGIWAWPRGTG